MTDAAANRNKNSAKKTVAGIILIVGGVTALALALLKPPIEKHPVRRYAPLVDIHIARSRVMRIPVFTRGKVTPRTQINLIGQAEGVVKYVSPNFHSGGYVDAGELLVQIEDTRYRLALVKKRSAVASANLFWEDVKAKSKVARVGAKRNATAYARYVPQLKEAEAKVAAAKADLEMAELELSFTEIRSPFAGRIRETKVDLNQYVKAGTVLADIYSLDSAEIRLPITDKQLALIDMPSLHLDAATIKSLTSKGYQLPTMTVRANYGGETISRKGRIVNVEGGLDENQLLYIVGEIKNPFAKHKENPEQPPLEVGLFVEVEVEGKYYERVFPLPRQVLRSNSDVWLIDKEGKLKIQPVHHLYRGPDRVYIDQGLNDGDRIVTSVLDYVVDGMELRYRSPEESLPEK